MSLRIDTSLSATDARTIDRLDRVIDTPSTPKAQPFVSELGKAMHIAHEATDACKILLTPGA